MKESRAKLILKYVLPTVLSQCTFFLFTIVDGIFVGRGVGTDALGAVNLAQPLVMVIGTVFMLTTIGGVTITAIRMGRKDYEGANQSFMHATAATVVVAVFFTVVGAVFTKPLAVLLGASGVYVEMVCDISSGIPPLRFLLPLPPPCRALDETMGRLCSLWFPPSSAPPSISSLIGCLCSR